MTDKPKSALDVTCPACGAHKGYMCRRRPRGLSYTVSMPTPCFVRTNKYHREAGLYRKTKKLRDLVPK